MTALLALGGCAGPALDVEPLPGAQPMPPETVAALQAAWTRRTAGEELRSRHRRSDGSPKYTNRLLLQSSPYLRQHAHNPVDWHPWGEEAFELARRLGRPLLLSVGYSTCHWCHVMEEESFEDEEIARVLNERYVAIKVDREQRPDVDSIYMTAVQAVTGQGGWPMTVWLTPEREPFFAGTYFPARDGDRPGATGFLSAIVQLADAYRDDEAGVRGDASALAQRVRKVLSATPAAGPSDVQALAVEAFGQTLRQSGAAFDTTWGGRRGQRKFPSALPLRALLRLHRRGAGDEAATIATHTLEKMAAGGIRDHLGGGFHRYSVDPQWRVPHFEKMLYDNALLLSSYLEATQVTGRNDFRDIAREILQWVQREMTSPEGGFYSATDADSRAGDGRMGEGFFFTWTPEETIAMLGKDAGERFNEAYGVRADGNLEGRNVLYLAPRPGAMPGRSNEPAAGLEDSRALLLEARSKRPPPLRDDKVITAWNGLMIAAAAQASIVLGDQAALAMASRAADFVLGDFASSGRLARSAVGSTRSGEGFLEDYAFLEQGLLDLFEAGGGRARLDQAIALDAVVEREFEDPAGGWFLTAPGRSDLLVRERSLSDGAIPSGSSVATLNLLRLAELTGDERYRRRAEKALALLRPLVAASPLSFGDALLAIDYASDTPKEIVLVTGGDRQSLAPFLERLASAFVPNRVLVAVTSNEPATLPIAERKTAKDGRPTAYVCENRVCEAPTGDPELFAAQIRRSRPWQTASPATGASAPP